MNYGIARAEKRGGGVSKNIDGMLRQSRENLSKYGISIEVYSAIREELLDFNATNQLIEIAEFLNAGNIEEALFIAKYIKEVTIQIIEHNYSAYRIDIGLHNFIDEQFLELFEAIQNYDETKILDTENDYSVGDFSIMGFGEIFRAKLQVYLLTEGGKNVVYVDPYKVEGNLENLGEVLDFYIIEISKIIENNDEDEIAIIVPGFIPNLKGGINGMIGRGFTDTITGLVALAIHDTRKFEQVIFELQKDVNGVMSTNPKEREDGFRRVQLIRELSVSLAKKLFTKHGANSKLLNEKTLNPYVIEALERYDNFSVEISNPSHVGGEKTVIKKEVSSSYSGISIIASREDIPNRLRQGLGIRGVNSLYLLGENLSVLEPGFIEEVSTVLSGINGVSYYIHEGMLVVNFEDDYDPRKDSSLIKSGNVKEDERDKKYQEIIQQKGKIILASEKQRLALNLLHRKYIEPEAKLAQTA